MERGVSRVKWRRPPQAEKNSDFNSPNVDFTMGNFQKVFHFSEEGEGGLFQICDARKSDPPTTATDPPLVFQNLGSKGGSVAVISPDGNLL